MCFLGLPWQITTNLGASNNKNVFSHSAGGYKSTFKVWAAPCSLWRLQWRVLPGLCPASGAPSNPAPPGLWLHRSTFCRGARSLLLRAPATAPRAHMNPAWLHLNVTTSLHKDPGPKQGYALRLQVDLNGGVGGVLFNPPQLFYRLSLICFSSTVFSGLAGKSQMGC